MSDSDLIFIYPVGSGIPVETHIGGIGSYAINYTAFLAYEQSQGATVTSVIIVADTSQAIPYTAYITSFQYNGVNIIPMQ